MSLRISGGEFKNLHLNTPPGRETRPTSERARSAIFDMLRHAPWGGEEIFSGTVLDGFAGTGALGLEALSRGCHFAYFFEKNIRALKALTMNIERCKVQEQVRLFSTDILRPPIFKKSWEMPAPRLIFLDPPYEKNLVPRSLNALKKAGWLENPDLLIVAETGESEIFEAVPGAENLLEERRFGAAMMRFWCPNKTI
ncbi:16S rRNA (guanine(966)-N(2))-methyltransferase RsmD [Acetobacteraceae bacterium]|nr:16S rRNA (guanine(966)-N(2))-methyltransferase RsmD [Acetobacteraceae bacterium]